MSSLGTLRRIAGEWFLPALAYGEYRTLWLATFSGAAAAWGLIVARGWVVFTLSGSSTWVGITTFAAMIPLLIVPPIAGLLADRVDRRTLLATAFAVNLVHNLVLAGLALTGSLQVWHLVLLALVNGSARSTQMLTTQTLVPNLVPRPLLLNAIALNSAAQHGSKLVGPGLVAGLLGVAGPGGVFLLCTAFYALGLLLVLRLRTESTGSVQASEGTLGTLWAGLAYVYHQPLVLALVLLVAAHCALTMSFEALLPVLSRVQFQAGGAGFGSLMMAVGAGALTGSVALAGVQRGRTRGVLLLIAGIASGITPLALAASPSLPVGLVAAAGMGASQAGFMALAAAMVQALVPDAIRGRVSSIYFFHAGGVMAFASLLNGAVADLVSAPPVLTVTGLVFVSVMAASFLSLPLRRTYARGLPALAAAS